MKKIILTALLLAACATSALAAAFTGYTATGGLSWAASNNVSVDGKSASTGYVFESKHLSGSRIFITDSIASKIYWKASDPTALTGSYTAPTSSTAHGSPDPTTAAGWTAL